MFCICYFLITTVFAKTCRPWSEFLESYVWGDVRTLDKLRTYWGSYMPKSFTVTHHRQIIAMKCTEQ